MGSPNNQYSFHGKWVRSRSITEADTGTTVAVIDVPAGTFIPPHMVVLQIVTGFSGGTPSIDIGDQDDADGWIDTVDITEGTPGTYSGSEATTGAYDQQGRVYLAENKITATLSASLTTGKGYVMALLVDVADVIND